jgi:signal transduction histidine kinase
MTLFAVSTLITSIVAIVLGVFVVSRKLKDEINLLFFLLSVALATWAFGLYKVVVSGSESEAMFWLKVLYLGAIFIPVIFYHFLSVFLRLNRKIIIAAGYVISSVFLLLNFFSRSFIQGAPPLAGFNYWVKGGTAYYLFFLYFVISIMVVFIDALLYRGDLSETEKRQFEFIKYGSIIGFLGGTTNFFPQFFNVYPFGNYLVIFFLLSVTYSIVKYQLFNIKVIATQLLIFVIWIALVIQIFLAENLQQRIIQGTVLVLIIFFGILLIRSVQKEVKDREEKERLAEQLGVANIRLRALDQAKSDFITIASHQLRSPLTAIKGYSSLILEGSYGAVTDKLKDPLNKIFASASHMVVLIDDFLNLSRIERGKMEFTFAKADLKQMIKDLFDEYAIINEKTKRNLELDLEIEKGEKFELNIDGLKIRQVMGNLIDNAVKYTKQGYVKVSLYKDKDRGRAIFKVQDNGVGMDKETQEKIFQKFVRATGMMALHTEGVGLGLYVAKKIIDVHQGRIWAESEGMGKGSTFYIELPLNFVTPAVIEIQDDTLLAEPEKSPAKGAEDFIGKL